DGTTAVVRSEHLSAEEIEFTRWRAERWMKLRHFPAVLAHSPWFVLPNARRMLRHTFTGSTLKSMLGLENDEDVFARFRAARRRERETIGRGLPEHAVSASLVPARSSAVEARASGRAIVGQATTRSTDAQLERPRTHQPTDGRKHDGSLNSSRHRVGAVNPETTAGKNGP